MPPPDTVPPDDIQVKHTLIEDVYALTIGCSFIVLGLVFLKAAGLVTGGVAGIALLLSYVVPLPVGVLFTLINIPFFIFAYRAMGGVFMIKTAAVSLAIMAMASYTHYAYRIVDVHPLFAAVFGGTTIGMGILSLARHGAGAGGTGVLSLYLQKTKGINAGRTQLVVDMLIIASALFVLDWHKLTYSAISAAAMSAVMVSWHKPERYKGY
jgi:uncharacterized membrane-anchored protein YitT (DUF2179 family)